MPVMEKVRRFLLVGVTVLLTGPAVAASRPSPIDAKVESIRRFEAGDYPGAIALLDEVLARRPHDFVAHVRRGNAYLHLDQPARALVDFDQAVFRRPDYAPAYQDRGVCLAMLGRDEDALRNYLAALRLYTADAMELRPTPATFANLHCGLGDLYLNQTQPASALRAYNEAIRLVPNAAPGFVGRGASYAAMGRLDLAMPDFDRALQLNPRHSRALARRGHAFAQLGRDEKALADFGAALAIDPTYCEALSLRASVFARIGEEARALADLDAAIRLEPKRASGYKDRGGLLVRLGHHERAIRDLDEAIRLDPKRAASYLNRAAAYNSLGKFDRALADGDEAIRLDPDNPDARGNRAVSAFNLGHREAALSDFDAAIRLDPRDASKYRARANALALLGRRDVAILDYAEAIRLEPHSVWAADSTVTEEDARLRAQAAREYEMSHRIGPRDADASLNRGRTRRGRGDWEGALADFNEALRIDPKRADAHAARGWTLLLAGRDGGEADARAFLDLRGGKDPDAARIALLGHLAARRVGRDDLSRTFLDEAIANTAPASWPSPILRHLRGHLSASDLLAAAGDDPARLTDAHAHIGLDRMYSGDRIDALAHLRWVRDRGARGSAEALLAVDALERLEREAPSR